MKKRFVIKAENIRQTCLEAEKLLHSWQIPELEAGDIVLCIDEALTNIKIHGYHETDDRFIWINIFKNNSQINIIIRDQARPYSIEGIQAPDTAAYLESDQVGGFGVSIIKKLMDSVKIMRVNNENVLWMSKSFFFKENLKTAGFPEEIKTSTADAVCEEGILKITTHPNSTIALKDAEEHISSYLKLIEHYPEKKAFAMMVNTRGLKRISKEAREYYTNQPQMNIAAIAIIIDSVFGKWLANIFIRFNKHDQEVRLFNSETEAIVWLKSFDKQQQTFIAKRTN